MLENADNVSVCPGRFSLRCWACWIENSQATRKRNVVSGSVCLVSESAVLVSDSWPVSESWLVPDSAVLVDSVALATDFCGDHR